jgi:hypothetical protein
VVFLSGNVKAQIEQMIRNQHMKNYLGRIFHRFLLFDSWVSLGSEGDKPFQRFFAACETVKTVSDSIVLSSTQLKLGVNEKIDHNPSDCCEVCG